MTRLLPHELLLCNLMKEIPEGVLGYMPQEMAHEILKELSHEDFGLDYDRWKEWVKKNRDVFTNARAWNQAIKTARARLESS
jgi:hypothetical protein